MLSETLPVVYTDFGTFPLPDKKCACLLIGTLTEELEDLYRDMSGYTRVRGNFRDESASNVD
jgi:hypothetical protein